MSNTFYENNNLSKLIQIPAEIIFLVKKRFILTIKNVHTYKYDGI
jgi:hypothetical protein